MNIDGLDLGVGHWLAFIDEIPFACDVKDLAGRFIQVNRRFEELHGVGADEVVGATAEDVHGATCGAGLGARDHTVRTTGLPTEVEYTVRVGDRMRTVHRTAFAVRNAAGELVAIGGIARDVSRERAAELVRSTDDRYQTLFDQAPVAIWEEDWSDARRIVDGLFEDGVEDLDAYLRDHPELLWRMAWECAVIAYNEMAVAMYGARSKADFWPHAVHDFRTEDVCDAFRETVVAFAEGRPRVVVHAWDKTVDGRDIYVRDTAFIPRDYEHDWGRVVRVNEDITEAHRLSKKLSYEASHDALTGLINRREFESRLRRIIDSARDGHSEHALCYLDLDQFKLINDTCGHNAGDELLRQLARELTRHVRRRDTFARLGGDEFGVLMEHCSPRQARRVAETLRQAVDTLRFQWGGQVFRIGVSIGLVPIAGAHESITDVMSAADAACYAAKDQGRNRIHVHDPRGSDMARRRGEMRWATRLREALDRDGFRLMYQPIVPASAHDEARPHIEVLLRLPDESGTDILPEEFIRASERYDLSGPIDRWVIEHTLRWLAERSAARDRIDMCCINLSSRSIDEEGFLAFVERCIGRTGVAPERLCFEITETTVIGDLAHASDFMSALRERGCKFALDDFGSGFSSFAYLRRLPIDYVKIDGSFVENMLQSELDRTIVSSINDMGHALGARTIAERVESDTVREALQAMGVDLVQGYAVGAVRSLDGFGGADRPQ